MREHPVEAVGRRRAGRTASRVAGPEHEVVDDQLRAPVEQLRECARAFGRIEAILLLHLDPRQLASQFRQLVTEPGVLLLPREQRLSRGQPRLACSDLVITHHWPPLVRASKARRATHPSRWSFSPGSVTLRGVFCSPCIHAVLREAVLLFTRGGEPPERPSPRKSAGDRCSPAISSRRPQVAPERVGSGCSSYRFEPLRTAEQAAPPSRPPDQLC